MPSALVQVADAVVASLNAANFGIEEFECKRSYTDWDRELTDGGCLYVDVVPDRHSRSDIDDRGSTIYDCQVLLIVRKKFGQAEQTAMTGRIELEEMDRLLYFTEQLHDHFCKSAQHELADNMNWRGTEFVNSYATNHLKEWRQFSGILRLTYEFHREL